MQKSLQQELICIEICHLGKNFKRGRILIAGSIDGT